MSSNLSSSFLQINFEMAKTSEHKVYAFDEFQLDVAKLMLYRDGDEISLPPKAVETLAVLVENQGEILSKDELMDRVWTDSIVEESNLSQYLYLLRKTLGNQPDGKPYIETLRRRGYRFTAEAKIVSDERPLNGRSAEPSYSPPARRYDVERRGNVLAVADWQDQVPEQSARSGTPQKNNYRLGIAGAALVVLAVAAVSLAFVWYRSASPAEPVTEKRGEMTIERLTNGIQPSDAAISRDGKYFAYSEYDGDKSRLIVQQTGQTNRLEIVPMSEKKISGKTFSPDGVFIYYVVVKDREESKNSLYRVPTLGGLQTKILAGVDSAVSFSPDGREMIFHRLDQETGESALLIASSDGGKERVLLKRARGQEVVFNPAWSPDGVSVAFAALFSQADYRINKVDLQTGEISLLSPEKWATCYRMVWTRDGEGLIFVGTRYAEQLPTRRDNVYYLSVPTGEARRLTVDGNRYQIFSLSVTDDDEILAVPASRLSQIWQMSPTGGVQTALQITHGAADGRTGIAPLPDGRVGYIPQTGENFSSVWLMNADGTDQKQLAGDLTNIEELRASPDGEYFVFSAMRDAGRHFFRLDVNGANLRQLTSRSDVGVDSTVSPDGNWIVYNSGVFDGGYNKHALWKIPSSGGEPVRVGDVDCKVPYFSPDGRMISCIRREKEILILNAETGEIVKTFDAAEAPVLNNGAHWTSDGQDLVYKVSQKNVQNLWTQSVDGGAPQQLTDFTANGVHNFAYSTDGLRLYVVRVYQVNDAVLIKNFR